MIFKIKARTDKPGHYGVTPFDIETGDSLGSFFGTKILPTFDQAVAYADAQVQAILALGDEASYEIVD